MGNGQGQIGGNERFTLSRNRRSHLDDLGIRQVLKIGAEHPERLGDRIPAILRNQVAEILSAPRQNRDDRDVQGICHILLGLDLGLEHHPEPHDGARQQRAKDQGQQKDHHGTGLHRRRTAESRLDDAEIISLGIHGNLGLLTLLLEQQVQRLDHFNLPAELLDGKLLLGDIGHGTLAQSQGPLEFAFPDLVDLHEIVDGKGNALPGIIELRVHAHHPGVGRRGIGNHPVALRDQRIVIADYAVQPGILNPDVGRNHLIIPVLSIQIAGHHVQYAQLETDIGQLVPVLLVSRNGHLGLGFEVYQDIGRLVLLVAAFG